MPIAAANNLSTRIRFASHELEPAPLPDQLPDDVAALKALLQIQSEAKEKAISANNEALRHIEYLYEQIALARRRLFAPSSEQSSGQAWLFNEAELLASQPGPEEQDDAGDPVHEQTAGASQTPAPVKGRGKRVCLPAPLPRVDIVHDLPEDKRVCPCGEPMVKIGEDVSEQLDIVPMRIQVLRHIRLRYGCPDKRSAPVTAPMPPQPLPKSNASAGMLAMLLTTKYIDGLPLARFEKVLGRHDIDISRQTLARWVIQSAEVLQPIVNLLRDQLFDGNVLHVDETTVQVLKEPGRAAQTNSYMWVQAGGPADKPVVIYDYRASRSAATASELIEGFSGFVMTDGLKSYSAALGALQGIEHQVCFAHCRRYFVEAKAIQPKGKRGRADQALELIGKLYHIERELKTSSPAERFLGRINRSRTVLDAFRSWLDKTLPVVTPKSALGKALAYANTHWPQLTRYIESGDAPIDNNRAENALRPFVVGRKAWLFSDTPAGANASAVLYSLVESARANALEPSAWLQHLLHELPQAINTQSVEHVEALLPWNLHPGTVPRIASR